jgi:hypothetical protein
MARTGQTEIESFLYSLPADVGEIVVALRDMIRKTIPQAEESVLWGSLSYHRPQVGGRVKGAVCLIGVKGGRARLDFIHGIRLADPSGLLQGHQASKRFVVIETVADVERPEIAALIREAAALDPTQ